MSQIPEGKSTELISLHKKEKKYEKERQTYVPDFIRQIKERAICVSESLSSGPWNCLFLFSPLLSYIQEWTAKSEGQYPWIILKDSCMFVHVCITERPMLCYCVSQCNCVNLWYCVNSCYDVNSCYSVMVLDCLPLAECPKKWSHEACFWHDERPNVGTKSQKLEGDI